MAEQVAGANRGVCWRGGTAGEERNEQVPEQHRCRWLGEEQSLGQH